MHESSMASIKQHIPNALTIARMVLALAFPFVPVSWRLPVLAVAAVTEYLDGFLSRLWKAQSELGKTLDPIADKLFVFTMIVTFWWEGSASGFVFFLLGIRDISVFLGCSQALLFSPNARREFEIMKPRMLGKITTTAQFFCLLSLTIWQSLHWSLTAVTTVLGILSGLDYTIDYYTKVKPQAAQEAQEADS